MIVERAIHRIPSYGAQTVDSPVLIDAMIQSRLAHAGVPRTHADRMEDQRRLVQCLMLLEVAADELQALELIAETYAEFVPPASVVPPAIADVRSDSLAMLSSSTYHQHGGNECSHRS